MLAAARKHKRVVQVGTQRKSTPHLIEAKKQVVEAGLLGKIGHVEICCYYHMRANGNPPRRARARLPRLRDVDRPGAAAALRRPAAHALVAHLHGIRQRHRGRHVRPHVRHGPLDARPGLAQAHQLRRRHLRAEGGQVEHRRHADRHLRVRRLQRRLAAPHLGHAARPGLSLGAVHLRRQGHAQGQHHARRLHPAGQEGQADPLRVRLRARAVSRGRDREGHRAERRARPRAATCWTSWPPSTSAAGRWPTSRKATSPPPVASWPTSPCSSAARWSTIRRRAVVGDAEATRLLRRPYRAPWVHRSVSRIRHGMTGFSRNSGGMPSLGVAEGRHGKRHGGFHAHPTLRVVRACHPKPGDYPWADFKVPWRGPCWFDRTRAVFALEAASGA